MKFTFDTKLDLLFIVLVTVFVILAKDLSGWVIDDLYIYFRYAENMSAGAGIVFNEGEKVEGVSGFLWLIFLWLCSVADLPLEETAKHVSLALSVLNIVAVYLLSKKILPGRLSIIAPILMMFCLPYMLWSVSGFENMLYIFLMIVSLLIITRDAVKNLTLLAFILLLISISRPEGILTAATVFGYLYFSRRMRLALIRPAIIFLMLFLVFLSFRYFYFGDILPNTYYAKIGHGILGDYEIRSYKNGLIYFLFFLRDNFQFIPATIFTLFVLIKMRWSRDMFPVSLVLLSQIFFIVFSGGDWMTQYRFAVPTVPLLALLTTGMLRSLTRLTELNQLAVQLLAVLLCAGTAVSFKASDRSIIEREEVLWNNLKLLAPSMNEIIAPGSLTASGACGIIPYLMPQVKFIDMVGLTDKTIAKEGYRTGMWFERSLPQYVYSLNPEWLIMWKKQNPGGEYEFGNAAPVYHEMSLHPEFKRYELNKTYDVYEDVKIELYKRKDR